MKKVGYMDHMFDMMILSLVVASQILEFYCLLLLYVKFIKIDT